MSWIIRHRFPALLLIDLIALQCAFYLTYALRFESGLFLEPLNPSYWPLTGVLSLFWLTLFLMQGMYLRMTSVSRFEAMIETLRVVVIGIIILFFLSLEPGRAVTNTRLVLFTYGFLILFFVGGGRASFRTLIRMLYVRRIGLFKTVLFGSGPRALKLLKQVRNYPVFGYEIVKVVSLESGQAKLDPAISQSALSSSADLFEDTTAEKAIEFALIALEPSERDRALEVIDVANRAGMRVMIEPDFMQILAGHVKTRELYGVPLLEVFPDLMSPTGRVAKRLMDVIVSALVLVLGLPFMFIVGLLIRLGSPGPALFRQRRVGHRGREFTLVKFRTMRVDAEKDTGAVWATEDDPRVTRIGRFLRNTRIDELPQAWNVLIGAMSLVGPRPERKVFVDTFSVEIPFYTRRLNVKPGITGWAQIRRGYDTSVDDVREKVQYDLFYLENISITLDIKILLNTLWVMLTAKGH